MILMKEYVSLTTVAMKIGERHFYSDQSNGCYEEKMLLGNPMLNYPGHVTLTSWTFLNIFNGARYHRNTKILKILASNFKRFRFYGIFKKWQIDERGRAQPNTTFC